jgi:LuxR family quorum sensing-dependent transcriptional regulator
MPARSRHAFAFVDELKEVSVADEAIAAIRRGLDRLGIECFAFITLPGPGMRFEDAVLAVHEPPDLLRTFRDNQYIHASPALRHCRRTVYPFDWKDAPYDRERDPRAAEVVSLLTDFDLSNAIMVPVPSPGGCAGGVWLAGRRAEFDACSMPMIHIMALYAFERLNELVRRAPTARAGLTAREREVLTWVAQGKSAWEIGEILGVAKRTIDEHTQTAMKKLGAANRTHAVAIAMRDRLIAP